MLIVARPPRFFKRPARCLNCLAAISIFSSPRYRLFHRRDINFSSPRYRFFLRRDIDFFFVTISIFSPHHGDIHSALQPRSITAIFIWPYSRTPSRRYSFGLTTATKKKKKKNLKRPARSPIAAPQNLKRPARYTDCRAAIVQEAGVMPRRNFSRGRRDPQLPLRKISRGRRDTPIAAPQFLKRPA